MSDEFEEDYEVYRERIREAPMESLNEIWPLTELATALAKAQGEMQNPGFDSQNPHFKNRFASLAAVRNAVVPVLAKHGIAMTQDITVDPSVGGTAGVCCYTVLTHASGQQMKFGPLWMPASEPDAQGFGSAATYCRRYQLMAVCGVVGDADDDAETAVGRDAPSKAYTEVRGEMTETLPKGKADDYAAQMRSYFDKGDTTGLLALDLVLKAVSTDARVQVYDICKFNTQEKVKFRALLADAHKKATEAKP